MIWLILTILAFRWARRVPAAKLPDWEPRLDTWAKFLLVAGMVLLITLAISLVGLMFADACESAAIASADPGGIAYWGTLRAWLLGVVITVVVL